MRNKLGFKLKNLPLFYQISLVISLLTISISLIMISSLPHSLREFFTREIYSTIEAAQNTYINPQDYNSMVRPASSNIRTVNHIVLYENGHLNLQSQVPLNFLQRLEEEAFSQEANLEKYSYSEKDFSVFYIIRKVEIKDDRFQPEKPGYLISFLYNSYREDLVEGLFKKLALLSLLILVLSFLPAFLLSSYLSQPLVQLEAKVKSLAQRQWEEEIPMDRQDEIGQLAQSIEALRLELLRQENLQANFLQNISHELKTPVMVIKSYVQAIEDGIYPVGDLASSLDIISQEANRLEDKLKSLLYITKLDYMEGYQIDRSPQDLKVLIDRALDQYRPIYPGLDFINKCPSYSVHVDLDQFSLLLENILNNMTRYANRKIRFSLDGNSLEIFNDGPSLENIDRLFEKFYKGPGGEIGLGLSIVSRIIDLHDFSISAKNLSNGVSFYIDMNKE